LDASVLIHFTDRFGGVSAAPFESNNLAYHVADNPLHVKANRTFTCKALGISWMADMEQVHGTAVRIATERANRTFEACDGLITQMENLALMVLVADCIPVLMHDPKTRTVAAVHAGRAGAFGGIVLEALRAMRETFGVQPEHLHVSLGPSIGGCCYELDGAALEEAKKRFGAHVHGRTLDLRALVEGQLKAAGVLHVKSTFGCTCCDTRYFSYRRDKTTGRQAGIIMLKGEDENKKRSL